MYKFFLTIRYLRTRRIAYFSMVAIALSVGMVLIVYSVMTGFLRVIEDNTRRISGDLIVEAGGLTTFPYYDELIAEARADLPDDIVAMTPVVSGHGLLKMLHELGREKDRTVYVEVQGIRFDEYCRVTPFRDSLFYEEYFPGTTSFDAARMPTWWSDDEQRKLLPDVYEAALAQYCADAEDPDVCDPAQRVLGPFYDLGPGSFNAAHPSIQNTPDYRGEPRSGAVLGVELVVARDGDEVIRLFPKGTEFNVTLLVPTRSGRVSPDPSRTLTLRYVDDSYTRVFQVDNVAVYCDFDWLQEQLDLEPKPRLDGAGMAPSRASRVQIGLAAGADPEVVRGRLRGIWKRIIERHDADMMPSDRAGMQRVRFMTWDQKHGDKVAPVRNERVLAMVLFGLISGVAVLVVGCVFYMIVQDKSREIGIIKSMGATSRGVAGIFVVYAFGIGLAGSVVGAIVGACFVWRINELQDFLAKHISPELKVWSPEVFPFERLPNTVDAVDAACIILVAIGASVMGSAAAAWRAARVWPVDALRYE